MGQGQGAAKDYHHLYNTGRWKRLRAAQLAAAPLCCLCQQEGRVTAATIADHIKPHRGGYSLFFSAANLQSLCKLHHDGVKQRVERDGFSGQVDEDGWPIDPKHPANK